MSIVLSELKRLHEKGMALIYLRPKSKRPFEDGWTSAKPKKWEELEASFEPTYNVGVRLGAPSRLKSGLYLGAIDCDVKSKSRKAMQEMNDKLRGLELDLDSAPIVMSGRGNGSKHIYVATREPMRAMKYAQSKHKVKVSMPGEERHHSKTEMEELTAAERKAGTRIRPAWEISFMGTGQQTVLPPSIHPDTGFKYAWASPFKAKYLPTFKPEKHAPKRKVGQPEQTTRGLNFKAEDVNLWESRLPVPFIKMIETGEGCEDRSASLMSIAMSMCRAGFTDNQILSVLSDSNHWIGAVGFEHAQTQSRAVAVAWLYKYTLVKARYETHIMRRFENKPVLRPITKEKAQAIKKELEEEHEWQHELQRTEKGGYKTSLTNVELVLSNKQAPNVFIHDLFSTRDSYGVDTEWGGKKGEHLSDVDLIKIRRWLSGSIYNIEPCSGLVLDAVKFIADRNKTHPVREWLNGLKWDGVRRLATWMKDYLGAVAPEPYLSEVSRLFLLAMIKRVFEPGCQWDYTIVLEGDQGTFKSTTARVLAGDKWFMDNLPDLRDKDAMLNLQGKWVIELGELADVKRGDYNAVKAYLNRRVDTVRSPYGMLKMDIPRQNVFVGTVNEGEYLKDPTGNRRFWPIRVGMCDVERLKAAREQLFAEAMWVYENCFDGKLMLKSKANQQAQEAQRDRRIDDDSTVMEDALLEFMADKKRSKDFNFSEFKISQLFETCMPWDKWAGKGYHYNLAAQVLTRLGFQKRSPQNGQRLWGK
jgi:predicted P-loop ATPase